MMMGLVALATILLQASGPCGSPEAEPRVAVADCEARLSAATDEETRYLLLIAYGDQLGRAGRFDEAVAAFEAAAPISRGAIKQMQDGHARALAERAAFHLSRNQPTRAGNDLAAAANLYPASALALTNLAKAASASDPQMALELYGSAISLQPDFAPAYSARGELYAAFGERDAAEADFTRAIALDPGQTGALLRLSLLQLDAGRTQAGLAGLDRVIRELGVDRAPFPAHAASDMRLLSQVEREHQIKAVAHNTRGQERVKAGDLDGAYADATTAQLLGYVTAESHHMVGLYHLKIGNPSGAIKAFDAALALDPSNAALRENRAIAVQQNEVVSRELALRAQTRQEADAARARARESEAAAWGRLFTGAVTAVAGGDAGQINQALAGQQVTASPSGGSGVGGADVFLANNNGCIAFERVGPNSGVTGPLYAVTNNCPLETSFAIGAYAGGENRGAGAVLAAGETRRIHLDGMRFPSYANLPVAVRWACPTRAALERSRGQRLTVQYEHDRDQCRVMLAPTPVTGAQ